MFGERVTAHRVQARPARLPGDLAGFTGRTAQLRQLDGLVDRAVVVIAGAAGVGKTALAVHWAHRVAARFPDGQLYLNLRGSGPVDPVRPPVDPGEALGGLLDALGVPARPLPAGLAARSALFGDLLAGRRLLTVLDNARDADHVRPLLSAAPGSLAVVTSRAPLAGVTAAGPVPVGLLSTMEAYDLLAGRLGGDRVAAEPAAVAEITDRSAGLPLALALVAARAAANPARTLAGLATELAGAAGRLTPLSTSDSAVDVRAVFSWSYRALSDGAGRLFRLLGAHPDPDVSAATAADLLGLHSGHSGAALAELVATNLVTEQLPGRYASHELLREYAAELARAEPPGDRPD
ncbi:MAG: hypothetical protein V7637_3719 [Mycobacteriales bacterium]